jgi:hypothetical protein
MSLIDLLRELLKQPEAKQLVREVLEMCRGELTAANDGDEWVDQYRSPLRLPHQKSSQRHCALVRRRIANGLPGAFISPDEKQFFLTTAALCEEMTSAHSPALPPVKAAPPQDSEESDGYAKILQIARRPS